MSLPIKLVSTDFDGTFFAEQANPPVADPLVTLIGELQESGAKWVINTGRDMPGLMESLERINLSIKPDYLVLVEREIHGQGASGFAGWADWNEACRLAHEAIFVRVREDLPRLVSWVNSRFNATIYEDAYSPFCLIAENDQETDAILEYLEEYCAEVPNLKVMRNSVYARFCHADYDKGTALGEICRRLNIRAEETFAAGDHVNDLPMLVRRYANYLSAPANALEAVKTAVRRQDGFVSELNHGHGVADALKYFLASRIPGKPAA